MNPESGTQWQRFLEHAALARAKPTFDPEERDWKLAMAGRLQETLRVAKEGGDWLSSLDAVYRNTSFRVISSRADIDWLKTWAGREPEAARSALAPFLEEAIGAEERFDSFARAVEEAAGKGALEVEPKAVLRVGSVLNFSSEPESLPMVQPGRFARLQRILGYESSGSDSSSGAYEDALAFARRVRSQMEQSGFAVRDMIDVHSLIVIAARESGFWADEQLHAVGVAPQRDHPDLPAGQTSDGRPYLTICAGYRNEAPYLAEWVEFHHLLGVEHFFLYDAHSTDDHLEVLAPYAEAGIVTTHDWEGISHEQADTYNECLRQHRDASRWMAFIDCDEFLFSPTGRSLPEVLSEYEHWPAVAVNWAVFGSSGHKTKPPGLVIENYLMRVGCSGEQADQERRRSLARRPLPRTPITSSTTPCSRWTRTITQSMP